MSIQRRRGQRATVFPTVTRNNLSGDPVAGPDMTAPIEVVAWFVPWRSSRAEVPGQQEINAYRMGVSFPILDANGNVADVDLWSRIHWNGDDFDVVEPPAQRFGTRHTRHQTLVIRRRTPVS